MTVKKQDARSRPYCERESRSASFLELRLNRCTRCLDVRFMHFDLRLEHRHGRIDPYPYEWSVIAFVGSNPNAVKAFARHKSISIRYDVKHDSLQSVHTRVLTESQAPRSGELFFGWVSVARRYGFPLAILLFPSPERAGNGFQAAYAMLVRREGPGGL